MSDTYTVERSTHIDAPPQEVYERIADFHRWQSWSPYEGLDPNMQRTYGGAESGLGATYGWAGNMKAGAGTMEITEAVCPERVVIALAFTKPMRNQATATFSITPAGDGTRVSWAMSGAETTMSKVIGRIRSMDKMVGSAFEKGLSKLKAEAEAEAAQTSA